MERERKMPVSMVTLECPCCGREIEVIAVGSAHEELVEPKPRRRRRSQQELQELEGGASSREHPGVA